MKPLKEILKEARENKKAVPHFNISTMGMLKGVLSAREIASEKAGEEIPMIIGLSEGERDFMGGARFVEFLKATIRDKGIPVYVNADHTYSVERAREAIDWGFDMVVVDFADRSIEDNIKLTKEVVDYARENNSDILIEGEVGYIGSGSNIKEEIPEEAKDNIAEKETVCEYLKETGADLVAPAVGNVHGIIKSGNPKLNASAVEEISEYCDGPNLVLHGASGSSDEDIRAVIKSGINVIHFSSELRLAYLEAIKKETSENETLAPYKYLKPAISAVEEIALKKIELLWR